MAVQLDVGRRGPINRRWRNQPPDLAGLARRRRRRCRPRAPARSSAAAGVCASTSRPRPATPRASTSTAEPADRRGRPSAPASTGTGQGLLRGPGRITASHASGELDSSGNGISTSRRSGTRESGSTSSTRSTASAPAGRAGLAHRLCDPAAALARSGPESASCSPVAGPSATASSRSVAAGPGSSGELGRPAPVAEPRAIALGAAAAPPRRRQPPAGGEPRREPQRAQRAPAPLGMGEQPGDQQLHRALELLARDGLGQLELDRHLLAAPARAQRLVLAARQLQRPQPQPARSGRRPRRAAAPASRPGCRCRAARARWAGRPRRLVSRPPVASSRPRRSETGSGARNLARRRRRGRSGGARSRRARRVGAEAAGAGAEPRRDPSRPAGALEHPVDPAPEAGAGRRPRRRPRPARSDSTAAPIPSSRRSVSSQARSARSGSGGISASSGQRESASPSRMPARTPERLGRPRDLPDQLRRARLGGQRRRPAAASRSLLARPRRSGA